MSALIVSNKRHVGILGSDVHPFQSLLHLIIRTHTMHRSQSTNILLLPLPIYPVLTEQSIRLGEGSNVDLSEGCIDADEA